MPYMCHSDSCTNPSYICDCFHNCSVASFPGGIGFAVTSLLMQKASGTIRWGGGTIALATWQMNWWPPTLRMETHRPFLLFDLLNFDLHYRREAGGSLQLFPPSSITWTLSHCSYHPKQLYIWKLSWLYHTHKNSLHRLLDTKRSLLVTKHTVCVNNVKHNCELHPNAYRLEPTVCWKCFLQLQ